METHVLVPIDGSEPSWKAFEYALSDLKTDTITALHVVDPVDGPFSGDGEGLFGGNDGGFFGPRIPDRVEYSDGIYEAGPIDETDRVEKSDRVADVEDELVAEAQRRFDTAVVRGAETLETAIGSGRPARTIVDYAEKHGVSHIVIGSHGREGVSRVLLGSVAEKVARRAPVPVTIVR